jgi:hypothetical protein
MDIDTGIEMISERIATGSRNARNLILNAISSGSSGRSRIGNSRLRFRKENMAQTIYVWKKAER